MDPQVIPIVYVVDDDVSIRESLEMLIRSAAWLPMTYGSAEEFLGQQRIRSPSCLLLDVAMPGLSGLELQKIVRSERADLPIIFITGQADVPMSVQAMKAGAAEFLTKPFSQAVLLQAISLALQRSKAVLESEERLDILRDSYESLSHREREVMSLVVTGLLNKQVGGELGISEITVKAHRGSVMKKMRAASLPDLVHMSAMLGIPSAETTQSKMSFRRAGT